MVSGMKWRLCWELDEGMNVDMLLILLSVLLFTTLSSAQAIAGALRGQITDPSGAAITNATVVLTPSAGSPVTTQTDSQGMYELKGLPSGKYTLNVIAEGFTVYENDNADIAAQPLRLNVRLTIAMQEQKIQVSDTAPTVDVNPANNAGAIVLRGADLDALPDDPDELQTDLEALAGPSAGPNGGQIYIDGFTGGQLPPKSSIREIRINQNPFSAEYDKLGYGRIEIFTKPGTDKFHGQVSVMGNTAALNSQNPFLQGQEPPYHSMQYMGNIGGPLGKKASFFFDLQRRNIDELSVITACTTPPCDGTNPNASTVPNPHTRTNLSPRLDYQISKDNTLTARYQYFRDTNLNAGLGQLALPSQAYDGTSTEQTLQISDTQVLSTKVINETRFQYLRENSQQIPQDTSPTITVLGAFIGGGSSGGNTTDHQDHYELQNYTSMSLGNHFLKFGGRLRAIRDASFFQSGFNGTFIFSSLNSAADTPSNPNCDIAANPSTPCPVSYLFAVQQLAIPGGTPYATQLSYTSGLPNADVTTYDAGCTLRMTGECDRISRSVQACASKPRTTFTITGTRRRGWGLPGESAAEARRQRLSCAAASEFSTIDSSPSRFCRRRG